MTGRTAGIHTALKQGETMRAMLLKLHWPGEAGMANYLRRLGSNDIEIGLGATAWAGLIFAIVHFGGGTV